MRITLFGTGYVGLVSGACFADVGNRVLCVDVDAAKIDGLEQGRVPIFEPGLAPLVHANHAAGRLQFTTSAAEGIAHGDILFIAVGTPPDEDGSADLRYVLEVARTIGSMLERYAVIVDKSTVPVGTADKVRAAIRGELDRRGVDIPFDVVSNPEFLKEGAAVQDCMKPDRIVIGSDSQRAVELLMRLYAPFTRNHARFVVMDVRSAELTKYAANAMLATKISFMNEMACIAEQVGADIEQVRLGIGSDPRIGYSFIYPGIGYGGSCFPKDVRALRSTAGQHGCGAPLLDAVERVNEAQKGRLFAHVRRWFDGDLRGRTVAVWGLSFKPDTDDMREAPSKVLLRQLWDAGARVRAYDPEALEEARRVFGERDDLVLCQSQYQALEGADALVVVTEWKTFRSPDFTRIREAMANPVVFDGRNIFNPLLVEEAGIAYYGVGRGRSVLGAPLGAPLLD